MIGADHLTLLTDLMIESFELCSRSLVKPGIIEVFLARAAVNNNVSVQIRRQKGRLRPNLLLPLPSFPIVF